MDMAFLSLLNIHFYAKLMERETMVLTCTVTSDFWLPRDKETFKLKRKEVLPLTLVSIVLA